MSVVVVGLNHRTAPLALLEQMAVDDAALPKALHDVVSREHVSEAVVLSTCNRTEVSEAGRSIDGITWDQRPFRPDDVTGYWLVMAATDDPATNRAIHDDGEEHHVWVNSADDTENCSFLLPSRIRRGPLLVTFSTSGEAPSVARWLRRTYDEEFGDEHVAMIELVAAERRRIQAEGRTTEGLSWQEALDSGTLDLIREGRLAEAKERLQACLLSSSD